MPLWWMRFLYDATLILYATSLTLFFSDVLQPRRGVNRSAVLLLFVAFLTTTGVLFGRFLSMHAFPAYTKADLMLLIAWILLVSTLVLDTFFRIGLTLLFVNVLGFFMFLGAGYREHPGVVQWFPNRDLLLLHILLSMLSEVAFAFAFVFALMYLFQEYNLRNKRWTRWFLLLPSLARLDAFVLLTTSIGFVLLFAGMAIGDLWGKLVLGTWIVWSPKPLVSICTWLLYGVYIAVRSRRASTSHNWMIFQIVCFVATLVNLVAVSSISPFHHTT